MALDLRMLGEARDRLIKLVRAPVKLSVAAVSLSKQPKQDLAKDESKSGKPIGRTSGSSSTSDRDLLTHPYEGRQGGTANVSSAVSANGNTVPASVKGSNPSTKSLDSHGSEVKSESRAAKSSDLFSAVKIDSTEVSDAQRPPSSQPGHSPRDDNSVTASKSGDELQKGASPSEELDRLNKRWKGEVDSRDLEGDVRFNDRERSIDPQLPDKHYQLDLDKSGSDEQIINRVIDRTLDRANDKGSERHDSDYRERLERPYKSHADDIFSEKLRHRSMERYGKECLVERVQERGADRGFDRLAEKPENERNKDDRIKLCYYETSTENSHVDDQFHGQNLPPPPPLPPHVIPQSVNAGRRDDEADRRFGTTRHTQRLSPRQEERGETI